MSLLDLGLVCGPRRRVCPARPKAYQVATGWCGVQLERLESRLALAPVTFAQFGHLAGPPQRFAYTNNDGTSADFSTLPGGDSILLSFDARFAPGLTSPLPAHLFLTSHTTAPTLPPLTPDNATREHFPLATNTIRIILDTPIDGKSDFLTVTYSDVLAGVVGSHEASLTASDAAGGTPPDTVSFTSDFINFSGTTSHGVSLAFSSVNAADGSGGLQAGAGGFFKSFTAAGTGTFDTNFSGQIRGQKFQDTNGNGRKDPGEPGLAGWRIFLDGNGVHRETVTDSNGDYAFADVDPGTYRISEEARPGWIQTTVNPDAIPVVSGAHLTGIDFGNFQLASIAGLKFQDSNGNGVRDAGEPGLAGWTIVLDAVTGSAQLSTVTDATGSYRFTNLPAGTYRIREVEQPGWVQTTVNPGAISVVSGTNVTGVDFGNQRLPPAPPLIPVFPVPGPPPSPPSMISKLELFAANLPAMANGLLTADSAFIGRLYHNLLNRPVDSAGLAHWLQLLLAGVSRQQIAMAIWQSPEHRGVEVDQFYTTFLGRRADADGRTFWVDAFLAGAGEGEVIRGFLTSAEYQATHVSDVSFLNGLYGQVLARPADPQGLAGWLQALQGGLSRQAVARIFLTSAEVDRRVVDEYYSLFFNRPPDAEGEQLWTNLLLSGRATFESAGEMFLASDEYFRRAAGV